MLTARIGLKTQRKVQECQVPQKCSRSLRVNIHMRRRISAFRHFLNHSDRIRGSKVIKHLKTIVIFSRGRLSRSLRVNIKSNKTTLTMINLHLIHSEHYEVLVNT